MTRKDYVAVANILAGDIASHKHAPAQRVAIENVGLSLEDWFAKDNPRFDRDRFRIAAGISR